MLKDVVREAADVAASRPAPLPAKTRKKQGGGAAEYPREPSESDRALLREALYAIAERVDDGIVAVEGTNDEWARYEAKVLGTEDAATTTPPNRFSIWRRLMPTTERVRVGGFDVQIHYATDTVDGDVHVRRVSVSVYRPDGSTVVDGANPRREAVAQVPAPPVNVRRLLRQLWRLAFPLFLKPGPDVEIDKLGLFVRNLRAYIRARKKIKITVSATSISIVLACSAWYAWQYAHITRDDISAAVVVTPVYDAGAEERNMAGWAALLRWTDPTAPPNQVFVIYRDGRVVAETTAADAWYAPAQVYQWADTSLVFGKNHTYRLGKKMMRMKTIYVTPAMDLTPCWRCLQDELRGRFDDEERPAMGSPPKDLHGGMYGAVGFPVRFGGRFDSRTAPPNPHVVPPPTRVEVDFGDNTPVRVFSSDNIVHTYLAPGTYTITMRPLDPNVLTPAPWTIRIVGSKKDFPRARWVDLVPPSKSDIYEVALSGAPGRSLVIPLKWWLTQVLHDLGGDYLENIEIALMYDDGTPMEFVKLSSLTRKLPDGTYEIVSHPRHTWQKAGRYILTIFAFSYEQGTFYKTHANVVVVHPLRNIGRAVQRAYTANRDIVVWRLDPTGTYEGYIAVNAGREWRASLRPWLDLVHNHTGADRTALAVEVDYGDGTNRPIATDEMGDGIIFGPPGHTWAQLLITDKARDFYYIGETKIDIRAGASSTTSPVSK